MTKFLPYARQCIEADDVAAVTRVLTSDHLTSGPAIEAFEAAFATCVGAAGAVAVSSGTAALHSACAAVGIGPGDEVIVPAISFVATANCARYLGAEPVFADVDERSGLLLPEEVERLRGPRTRAVIPVHLGGACADLEAIRAAAGPHCALIEDACHALGARYRGRPIGACLPYSSFSAFSFHPVKHVTTGEGGAVTCADAAWRDALIAFRNHGVVRDATRLHTPSPGPWYYEQQSLGHNYRISDIHAALGLSQLPKLERFVGQRRALARRYDALLEALPGVIPCIPEPLREDCAYHLYGVHIDFDGLGVTRAALMRELHARGIGSQVHFIPIPMQPYYRERGGDVAGLPGTRRYYARQLSLPLFPAMQLEDVDHVVEALSGALGRLARGSAR